LRVKVDRVDGVLEIVDAERRHLLACSCGRSSSSRCRLSRGEVTVLGR
jgi:hypothetical protein